MPTLVLASRNAGKLRELTELLAPLGVGAKLISDFPDVPETVEDGETFAANAAKKAVEAAVATRSFALGEDSGLAVDALDGRPGVYSARYAGTHGDDAANNAKLLEELDGVPDAKRTAAYHTHIAVADPGGDVVLTAAGTCRGRIVTVSRGEGGFGYDPLFLVPEYHRTFGELAPAVKRAISHRARAMRRLAIGLPCLFDA
ncbi:MAG: RdgB/HAM1 family non-canonical purine NTP pyrophosphatase [Planctomycetota bacterium]